MCAFYLNDVCVYLTLAYSSRDVRHRDLQTDKVQSAYLRAQV